MVDCSIRVYRSFSAECPKRSNYASNFFQNASIMLELHFLHYAKNYSGIITTLQMLLLRNVSISNAVSIAAAAAALSNIADVTSVCIML